MKKKIGRDHKKAETVLKAMAAREEKRAATMPDGPEKDKQLAFAQISKIVNISDLPADIQDTFSETILVLGKYMDEMNDKKVGE